MRPIRDEGRRGHADSNGSIRVSLALFVRKLGADPSVRTWKRLTTSWGAVAEGKQTIIIRSDERKTASGISDEKYLASGADEWFYEVEL